MHTTIQADQKRIYGGRFSSLGNLYYCTSQKNVLLFDSSDPYNFKLRASIPGHDISWTISDMDVDQREQFLIYSSIDRDIRLVALSLQGK